MTSLDHIRPGVRDQRDGGYAIALVALLLLPLLAFTGLAVDLGGWYARAAAIQRATDAAALAGVAALPRGFGAAESAAIDIARQNGFRDGSDGISVSVNRVGDDRVSVRIEDDEVPLYFTRVFRDEVSIARSSVAEYVPPVRMGSPRNFLGTQRLPTGHGQGRSGLPPGALPEEFFLSINSPCSLSEDGDLLASRWAGAGGASDFCNPSTGSTRANPNYSANGYIYGVRVEEGYSGGPITIEVFDAAHCPGGAGYHDNPRLGNSVFTTTFRVLDPAANPFEGAQLARRDVQGAAGTNATTGDCAQATGPNSGGWRNGWRALHTFTPEAGQVYGIQVYSHSPSNNNRGNLNNFALRARTGSGFQACSADPYEADLSLRQTATGVAPVNCPNLFAMEHLSIFANSASSTAQFYLASIGPEHSNKTLVIELFDPGEGGDELRLMDPLGGYVNFRRSVVPRWGDEAMPLGGWGPVNESVTDISATGPQPGGGRISNFRFNERRLRLEVDLPDIDAAYSGATWWRVEYRFGETSVTDRTTWSVTVRGDPVRLVE